MLAMYGRHDPYYPVELGEWIAEQCPHGEAVVFEESAHYPFIEEKERFAQVLSRVRLALTALRAATAARSRIAWAVRRASAMTVSIGLTPGARRQRRGVADPDALDVVQLARARRRPRWRGRRPCGTSPSGGPSRPCARTSVFSRRAT